MIRVLEKTVADKIAAGEVIDRPVSVVKELAENALDAGANSLTCEIKNGGKSFIRITDDGTGIPADEAALAFVRHATSKIETAKDLDAIQTLGFRGEALASIAAVSRTSMITKTRENRTGCRIVIHGGEKIEETAVGCPDGTTMIVSDLFYNTPARRKFLKSDSAEAARIIELMSELACANPEVRFRMISSGRTVFATRGDGDLKGTLLSVYHKQEYKNLLELEDGTPAYQLTGCISRPSLSRPTRREQVFFVNGRVVDSQVMADAVSTGYRERLFSGRHPVVYLFLTCDPGSLDVNIHPSKREVRFHDETAVRSFVSVAIRKELANLDAVIRAQDYYKELEAQKKIDKVPAEDQIDIKHLLETKRAEARAEQTKASRQAFTSQVRENGPAIRAEGPARTADEAISTAEPERTGGQTAPVSDGTALTESSLPGTAPDRAGRADFDLRAAGLAPFDIHGLTITGCIFDTYITCTDQDSFYLIDQHAAHERVFYEKLVGAYLSGKKQSQMILTPLLVDLLPAQAENAEEWMTALRDMGYETDLFGPDTIRITAIPTFMELGEAENFVRDFLDQSEEGIHPANRVVIDKLITRSCKSAVKAHDRLSLPEMQALLDQLALCANPFSCPHGRPTFIRFTTYDIEKFFKRVQ